MGTTECGSDTTEKYEDMCLNHSRRPNVITGDLEAPDAGDLSGSAGLSGEMVT
ncbi:MAG: hypothetical protein QOJ59_1006 [Thermomicrobiales bacterium]|nr:hypothetical protein [Thermomicrobiales bacterium]